MSRDDLDRLFGHLLPFAHRTLEKYGEFLPFGASLGPDGTIRQAMAQTVEERPISQELIDLLREGFKSERAGLVAIGVCFEVRIRASADAQPGDAICVALEHKSGLAVNVYEPYSKRGRAIDYGQAFSERGEPLVFGGLNA